MKYYNLIFAVFYLWRLAITILDKQSCFLLYYISHCHIASHYNTYYTKSHYTFHLDTSHDIILHHNLSHYVTGHIASHYRNIMLWFTFMKIAVINSFIQKHLIWYSWLITLDWLPRTLLSSLDDDDNNSFKRNCHQLQLFNVYRSTVIDRPVFILLSDSKYTCSLNRNKNAYDVLEPHTAEGLQYWFVYIWRDAARCKTNFYLILRISNC